MHQLNILPRTSCHREPKRLRRTRQNAETENADGEEVRGRRRQEGKSRDEVVRLPVLPSLPLASRSTKALVLPPQMARHLQSRRPSRRDDTEEQKVFQSSGPTNKNLPEQISPNEVPELFCCEQELNQHQSNTGDGQRAGAGHRQHGRSSKRKQPNT